jgi:signal transduction histidine kinase
VNPRHADLVSGLAGAGLGVTVVAVGGDGVGSVATAVIAGGALGASRRYPRATWAGAALLLTATASRGSLALFPRGGDSFALYLLVAAHAFAAGRWDAHWRGLGGPVALIGASEFCVARAHDPFGLFFFIVPAAWGAGRALRERERLAGRLAERARELDHEREAHARLSVRYERTRIASELHDIVAHAISVMVVQASAGQRLAADPGSVAEAFDAIAGAAHQAEADMGRLVALLSDETAIGPAPDLELVRELVARAAGTGLDVSLRLEGEREGLPAPVVEAAYRVVREGLTNALRYASGAAVRVLVRGDTNGLVVEVINDRAGAASLVGLGTGHGLVGLRERVGGCGGTLDAQPTPDGGWRLSAHLPRRVTTAASW